MKGENPMDLRDLHKSNEELFKHQRCTISSLWLAKEGEERIFDILLLNGAGEIIRREWLVIAKDVSEGCREYVWRLL